MYSNLIELVATYLRRVSMELQVSKVGPYQSTGIAHWSNSEPKINVQTEVDFGKVWIKFQ